MTLGYCRLPNMKLIFCLQMLCFEIRDRDRRKEKSDVYGLAARM